MRSRTGQPAAFGNRALRASVVAAGCLLLLASGCASRVAQNACGAPYRRTGLDSKSTAALEEFRKSVGPFLRKGNIPGCAFALVDESGLLWAEGFGHVGHPKRTRVTPDTLFRVLSVSKVVTAMAVLHAEQDGLLRLDEPITTYLPDLRLRSHYEVHPERRITLRRLLSHTSGLQAEPALGNSLEPLGSFEAHVQSILGSRLRFPVGAASYYSNGGIDLAAYILQVVSGTPFPEYVRQHLLSPLDMTNSSLTPLREPTSTDRAVGHTLGVIATLHPGPMTGAAGLESSAADLAKCVHLQLNRGTAGETVLLSPASVDAMGTPHAVKVPPDEVATWYGLGAQLRLPALGAEARPGRLVRHGGGGAGFSSILYWYPEYGIGGVALANRHPAPELEAFALRLPQRFIAEQIAQARNSYRWPEDRRLPGALEESAGYHLPSPFRSEWEAHCGTYRLRMTGYDFKWYARWVMGMGIGSVTPAIKVQRREGYLCLTESKFFDRVYYRCVRARLQEVEPGVFYTARGDCLDFTGSVPTYNNYRLQAR